MCTVNSGSVLKENEHKQGVRKNTVSKRQIAKFYIKKVFEKETNVYRKFWVSIEGKRDHSVLVAISRLKKSLLFQGPPLPMALEMDLPPSKSLRPAPYKQVQ